MRRRILSFFFRRQPEEKIREVMLAFASAKTWAECRRLVEEWRDILLTDAVDQFLTDLLAQYQGNATVTRLLKDERALLTRCRREGIDAAFVDVPFSYQQLVKRVLAFLKTDTTSEGQHFVEAGRDLLLTDSATSQTPEVVVHQTIQICYEMLAKIDRAAQPDLWAALQVKIGHILSQNPFGKRADNLEQAISCFRQALDVSIRANSPIDWAITLNYLGNAYANRIRGDRAENLEQAIQLYLWVLELYTRDDFPVEWAMVLNNLANTFADRIRGERADNLEQAISCFRQALQVRTQSAFPIEWAMTLNNLANAFADRIKGQRAENLERAIELYHQVLQVRKKIDYPVGRAATQRNLANAYANRIKGDRAENLEQAISHYEQALKVYTKANWPVEWAMTHNNLGNVYQNRIRGQHADNLEQAISHYQQALQVRTKVASPVDWAITQNNLGNAYKKRIRGERTYNLERAIEAYQQALEVTTCMVMPVEWATMMNNLANIYSVRIRGELADNIEQAIHHFQQTLSVYTRHAFPVKWATIMNNLGSAFSIRLRGEEADNLEQAIDCYLQALTVRTRQDFHIEWAQTMNNLANAYLERIRGERNENIERAIGCFHEALSVYTRSTFPLDWATSITNLATAYSQRIDGERNENIEQAIGCYEQALEVRQPEALPYQCRQTAYGLSHLLYNEGRFSEARTALVIAHQAVESLRGEVQREAARRDLSEQNADLYAKLVHSCLLEGNEEVAFEYATAGKGRAFVDLLASAQINLTDLANPELNEKVNQARQIKAQSDQLMSQLIESAPSDVKRSILQQELVRLRREEEGLWHYIRDAYPDYFATQAAELFTLNETRVLAHKLDATLVSFYRDAEGWIAFVIHPEEAPLRVVKLPVTDEQLLKWHTLFYDRLSNCAAYNLRILQKLYDAVIAPLHCYLPQPDSHNPHRLVLAPFSLLHLFPFAALRHRRRRGESRYLGDDYVLAVTPSLAALNRMVHRTKPSKRERLFAVGYPGTLGTSHYLPNVIPEVEAIAHYSSQATVLQGQNATPAAVIQHSSDHQIVHFACHGTFDANDVESSGLLLAGGSLRVRDIFNELRLPNVRLAVLSACETGRVDLHKGDELAGLAQSFMYAGAPAVIASLWAVNDAVTRYLFERFYSYYTAGISAAEALRIAQQELRQRGYTHPYYWAAFQPLGAVYDTLPEAKLPTLPPVEQVIPAYVLHRPIRNRMSIPNPQTTLNEAQMLLLKMKLDTDIIPDELLTPAEQAAFGATLLGLADQAAAACSDADLLALANAIVNAVEVVPALREEFLGQADSAFLSARTRSLDVFKQGTELLLKSDEKLHIANRLETLIKVIANALSPETEKR